jgi:tetratricopeptide (TPR) repeat protein
MKRVPIPSPYFDTNNQVEELYYDAMELSDSGKVGARKAEKLLEKAFALNPHSVQVHIGFAHVYGTLGDKLKANEHIRKAYEETQRLFSLWPKRMEWGVMENRPYMRAIQYRADLYADAKEDEKAIELYRLLLRMNPNDNQGVRYTLSGVYAGISGEEINAMFDEGNEKQNWDPLQILVKEQNARHKFWKEPKPR